MPGPTSATIPCQAPGPRRPRRRRHAGGALVLLIVTLLMVGSSALVLQQARLSADADGHAQRTAQRIDRAALALQRYALLHQRLPCPADGALDTGLAMPVQAPAFPYRCGAPSGTLPWKSLGLGERDALDAWGRKLSYRVSDGPAGVVRAGSLRRASTSGVAVVDRGRLLPERAWVLVSHGASGYGAWLPGGTRQALPAAPGDEWRNTQAAPPAFVRRDEQVEGLNAASAAAHFDDVLLSWPLSDVDAGHGLLRLDMRRLARPGPLHFTGRDAGVDSIVFTSGAGQGDLTLQAGGGHLARNDDVRGWAVGVCSGACSSDATSMLAAGQTLSLRLAPGSSPLPAQLALAVWSPGPAVQAGVRLRRAGATVAGGVLTLPSQAATPATLAVWTDIAATPAAAFDEVELTAVGGTRFFVAHLRLCEATQACE